jgi:hypothetical protein
LQLLEMPERSTIITVRPYAHRHGIRYANHWKLWRARQPGLPQTPTVACCTDVTDALFRNIPTLQWSSEQMAARLSPASCMAPMLRNLQILI